MNTTHELIEGRIMKYYFGYLRDKKELLTVTSGGFCTAIANHIIANRGVVYGKSYSDNFRSIRNTRVATSGEVESLKGSKYIYCQEPLPVENIIHDLGRGEVLFIGLPCEVAALKKTLQVREVDVGNLITVDLICHGPTSPEIAKEFLDSLEKGYHSKIIWMTVRYKKGAWRPPYLYAKFENGKEYIKPFYQTDYGIAFLHYIRKQCYECKFKGEKHVADITVGDGWGISQSSGFFNNFGVSTILTRTTKADAVLYALDGFDFIETTENDALANNRRYYFPSERTEKCVRFEKDYSKFGLHRACLNTLTTKEKILRRLPKCIKAILKKAKSVIRRL